MEFGIFSYCILDAIDDKIIRIGLVLLYSPKDPPPAVLSKETRDLIRHLMRSQQ